MPPSGKPRKKSLMARVNRSAMKRLSSAMNRVDFFKLFDRLAHSQLGSPWLDKFADMPYHWGNEEELRELTYELTLAQLAEEGHPAEEEEVRQKVDRVSIRYNHEAFRNAVTALSGVLTTLFTHHDTNHPFISRDLRDIAHLEELQAYRDQGLAVVYLANHSSHLDEFLVDGSLLHEGFTAPAFAAGANMMAIESIAKVFRCGAYTVARRGANRVDLAAIFNYCRALSETGSPQGIFLEAWHGGARSRDGSLRYPRRLVTLRGALAADKDVVIQPVACSFAMVPEDLPLAARKGGMAWFRGLGFWNTLGKALVHPRTFWWRAAKDLYGRAYISLPRPRLLSELKAEHAADPGGLHMDEFVSLWAIREIARTKKVMASQLVARGVQRARREDNRDLVAATQQELDRLVEYHQNTFGQDPDLEDFIRDNHMRRVVSDGLRTLRRRKVLATVRREGGWLPKVTSEPGLAFYATHGDRRIYSPTADENIVVVGAGDWGFALTFLVGHRMLEEKRYLNASLTLYDHRVEVARDMGVSRTPQGRFEKMRLPKNAFVTSDPPSAFRKASEVILASPPDELADRARLILETSEQPLKLVVAVCGMVKEGNLLPFEVVSRLAREMGRRDVEFYSLVGPVEDQDLVEARVATGILAGPAPGRDKLADLFNLPPRSVITSDDPLGVQAAVILARVYALWGNFLTKAGEIKGAANVGHYLAQAASEAARLGVALGAKPESFGPGSAAWIATMVAEGLSGPVRDLGRRLGGSKRRGDAAQAAKKYFAGQEDEGVEAQAYQDLAAAYRRGQDLGLELPILGQAYANLYGFKDN